MIAMNKVHQNGGFNLDYLNIADYEERCYRHLFLWKPKKYKKVWFLKSLAARNKTVAEINGVECDIIYPTLRFLKDLPSSLLVDMSVSKKQKYLYFKRKLLGYLQTSTIFNEYAKFVRRAMETFNPLNIEMLIRKYIRVCNLLHPRPELSVMELHQYELTAELLKLCYEKDVQNSKLIVALLKMAIDCYVDNVFTGPVKQPSYTDGFLKYILENSIKDHFNLQHYCMEHPRTLWEFSRKLSVTDAVSVGNTNRTLCLLQNGVEIFPENEAENFSWRFPFISKYLPRSYLMILHTMSRMRTLNNLIHSSTRTLRFGLDTATDDQKECFNLIWKSIPEPFVKNTELALAINSEFFISALHEVEHLVSYKENMALCDFYVASFKNIAGGSSEPRSLKHLCRCTIRNTLKQSSCLREGISQLRLSRQLEDYINLEDD